MRAGVGSRAGGCGKRGASTPGTGDAWRRRVPELRAGLGLQSRRCFPGSLPSPSQWRQSRKAELDCGKGRIHGFRTSPGCATSPQAEAQISRAKSPDEKLRAPGGVCVACGGCGQGTRGGAWSRRAGLGARGGQGLRGYLVERRRCGGWEAVEPPGPRGALTTGSGRCWERSEREGSGAQVGSGATPGPGPLLASPGTGAEERRAVATDRC